MKDPSKMPTKLERLNKIVETLIDWRENDTVMPEEEDFTQAIEWLEYVQVSLMNRKQYHKKRTLKLSLLKKMAETLLSQDELERIDAEAEERLEVTDGSN